MVAGKTVPAAHTASPRLCLYLCKTLKKHPPFESRIHTGFVTGMRWITAPKAPRLCPLSFRKRQQAQTAQPPGEGYKKPRETKHLPRPCISAFPCPSAPVRLRFQASSVFWLVRWGAFKAPASAPLPSRFPSGRLTPQKAHSRTYSNGYSSGLAPDFLNHSACHMRQSSRVT